MTETANEQFLTLWSSTANTDPTAVWEDLSVRFAEKARRYHGLAHIEACLREMNGLNLSPEDKQRIALAIFFHDAIYNPKGKRNEEESKDLFRRYAVEGGMNKALIDEVSAMILATKRHESITPGDNALNLFLDIDLSILGSDSDTYIAYAADIRKEYSHVPGFLYRPARKKILKNFLSRGPIYFTEVFRSRLEEQARENILAEIETL